jgi:hypothetical protein
MTKVVSFKDVGAPAAPTTTPQAENPAPAPAPAPAADNKPHDANAQLAPAPSAQLARTDGADEDGVEVSDIKLPKLKLLQGTSDKKLLQKFGFGALLFKDQILVARAGIPGETPETSQKPVTGRLVFVKLLGKTYVEKVAKFGDPSGFARSLAEVDELGGTTDWRQSKENKKSGSTKPWFQVTANCLVLVEKPETVTGDDVDHFPFEADGKFYAPAMYSVKSFAYDAFFSEIATAKATGELRRGGFSSRFINLLPSIQAGKGNAEFAVPSISFGEHTSDALKAIAAELA